MTRVRRSTADALSEAARLLRAGGLVAFPTETVYGLGAVASDDTAVARIFAAKGRPALNPLIVHVLDAAAASPLVHWNARADALARAFWPGPLTLVADAQTGAPLSPLVTAGGTTVAIRAPAAPTARALLHTTQAPLAAPSANPSGRVSPTTAEHVAEALGDAVDLILDGGPCSIGLESTVVDVSGAVAVLLRPGGVPRAAIEAVIGPLAAPDAAAGIKSPGQLASHYAPRCSVRLEATAPRTGEAYLGFGPAPPCSGPHLNLSPGGDLREAARNLFAMLRALDRDDVVAIAVAPIPRTGLGEAINDRLGRASARDRTREGD